jgi:uncharacterized protein (DUF983 family)
MFGTDIEFTILIIILVFIAVLLWLGNISSRKAEAKMKFEYFIVKPMKILSIMSFAPLGLGLFILGTLIFYRINPEDSVFIYKADDIIAVFIIGAICAAIGGLLSLIMMRWRMVVSNNVIIYTPYMLKTRIIRLMDVKYIRAIAYNPGFKAYDANGKKLFSIDGSSRGYMLLVEAISPYVDNAGQIPKSKGFFFYQDDSRQ